MSNNGDMEPVLGEQSESSFKKLRTIPFSLSHLLGSMTIALTGWIMHFTWPMEKRCTAYFIMLYLRIFFWFITFLFEHGTKILHKNHRMFGYHKLHRETAVVRGLPWYIVSLWNTTIMGIQALMQHLYADHFGEHCMESTKSPLTYIAEFCLLEVFVLLFVHGSYIAKVQSFNKTRSEPDALREMRDVSRSIGYTQRGAELTDLLEVQADLIEFYFEQNTHLNMRVLEINNLVTRVSLQD